MYVRAEERMICRGIQLVELLAMTYSRVVCCRNLFQPWWSIFNFNFGFGIGQGQEAWEGVEQKHLF